MGFSYGIIGLPYSGKTSLFNALTAASAPLSPHSLASAEPNIGSTVVPDPRLAHVADKYRSRRSVPIELRVVDIPGWTRNAADAAALAEGFWTPMREMDALLAVVRCFVEEAQPAAASLHPVQDMSSLVEELVQVDVAVVEKALEKRERAIRTGDRKHAQEADVLGRLLKGLQDGRPGRQSGLSAAERELLKGYNLLTMKPLLYIANLAEEDIGRTDLAFWPDVVREAEQQSAAALAISAEVEAQLVEFTPEEARRYAEETGIRKWGLDELLQSAYRILGGLTFYTAGEKEARAWPMDAGATALRAAGLIHSDIERGFTHAEVLAYEDLVHYGSPQAASSAGAVQQRGRDYVVQDGDILWFRFSEASTGMPVRMAVT